MELAYAIYYILLFPIAMSGAASRVSTAVMAHLEKKLSPHKTKSFNDFGKYI